MVADLGRFENWLTKEHVLYFNKVIPEDFYEFNKEVFNSEGMKGDHGLWPALSPKYEAWKKKRYPGKTIMRRTDKLYHSLTGYNKYSIRYISNNPSGLVIKLGTQLKYAEYHQEGIITKAGIKTRRTIDPTEWVMVRWLKLIHRAYVYAARYGPFKKGWQVKFPSWDKWDKKGKSK